MNHRYGLDKDRQRGIELRIASGRLVPTREIALDLVRRYPGIKGICRICGCTEFNACHEAQGRYECKTCGWADQTQTLCNAASCIEAAKSTTKTGQPEGYNPTPATKAPPALNLKEEKNHGANHTERPGSRRDRRNHNDLEGRNRENQRDLSSGREQQPS
jgi:hypothetical protein